MFFSHLLPTLALVMTLSATALAGAGIQEPGTRLGTHHRFAKRAADRHQRRQWGSSGGRGGRGHHKGGRGSKGKSSASSAAQGTTTTTSQRAQTSSKAATKTTTSSKAATTASSSSSSTYSGSATFYYQEGGTGSCGSVNADSAKIVALQSELYSSSYCGKSLTITNTANGKSVTATVADTCPVSHPVFTSPSVPTDLCRSLRPALAGVLV